MIEYLRSVLVAMDTLLEGEEGIAFTIGEALGRTIAHGLEECSQWHEALI